MSATSDAFPMPFAPPCVSAARRFDPRKHRRFFIDGTPFGWIRERDVAPLARWPKIFTCERQTVHLTPALATPEQRTEALGEVIRQLADDGLITGWRDEVFAIRNAFDDKPVALIERAASRYFGTMTYAVHVNGLLAETPGQYDDPAAVRLWIARRSQRKAVDPGMLDTLVGGGIGWGWGIEETLVKECWEESGIAADTLAPVRRGRTVHVLAEIDQGTQAEQLFIYDLPLTADFVPHAEDGEVAEHLCVTVADALDAVQMGNMTVDASLSTLDGVLRHAWLGKARHAAAVAAFAPLLSPPAFDVPMAAL